MGTLTFPVAAMARKRLSVLHAESAWALICATSLFMLSLAMKRLRPRDLQIRGVLMAKTGAAFRCTHLNFLFANRIDMPLEHDLRRRLGQLQFREPAPVRGG